MSSLDLQFLFLKGTKSLTTKFKEEIIWKVFSKIFPLFVLTLNTVRNLVRLCTSTHRVGVSSSRDHQDVRSENSQESLYVIEETQSQRSRNFCFPVHYTFKICTVYKVPIC